ncbi:5-deoxy-glucuronate isomerase [Kitasatospora sp. NPDC052896]|uniref:5-deoxy-glucuronate isomerase n=1 Tax=Kitasatospora sp. NPDC052896 TaxID=3364061 RepID=UPI0037C6F956
MTAAPDQAGLHLPDGSTARAGHRCWIDPESAGWQYTSLRILDLPPGGERTFGTGESEWVLLPLAGAATLDCDGRRLALHGRPDVFGAISDFAYLPRDATATVRSAAGGRFALAGARCRARLPVRYGPASEVPVEIRGAGHATRQVNNFAGADVFETDRLIAVEVLTPAGNWSSFPPHKHDRQRAGREVRLEEIYWFTIADAPDGTPGSGYHHGYPSCAASRSRVLAEVRTGDAVLVPDGYHGPSMASPGYDMYYLNAMAGPLRGPDRAWLVREDPAHAWIRDTWAGQPPDPRVPLCTAPAPSEGSR